MVNAIHGYMLKVCFMVMTSLILFSAVVQAEEINQHVSETPDSYWSLLGGYGISHKGLGLTKVQVQVLDLILQYDRVLLKDVGSSWYKGHHSLILELPLTLVVDPDVSPMIGVNILGAWTFDSSGTLQPYFFGGGGILYTNADIPGLGSDINGNWQFGTGIRYRLESGNLLKFEYR
ncbi:MAG: porin family protein, partial [Desulfobulbaceae bacterium]|nr:porin family protein [Desulfobulbaceae bacterium]